MKKNIFLALLLCLLLVGCDNTPIKMDKPEIETHTETRTTDYEVTKLFTVDGMTVYRFYDKGRYRYFVSNGELIDTTIDEEEEEEEESEMANTIIMNSTCSIL